jgi:hypothetical protein
MMNCLKLFSILDGTKLVASIMAERFDPKYGHFFIGEDVVGNAPSGSRVSDSGGRANYSFTPRAVQHCYDERCACYLMKHEVSR